MIILLWDLLIRDIHVYHIEVLLETGFNWLIFSWCVINIKILSSLVLFVYFHWFVGIKLAIKSIMFCLRTLLVIRVSFWYNLYMYLVSSGFSHQPHHQSSSSTQFSQDCAKRWSQNSQLITWLIRNIVLPAGWWCPLVAKSPFSFCTVTLKRIAVFSLNIADMCTMSWGCAV